MPFLEHMVGLQSAPHECVLTWEKASLYALGVGATPAELDLVYEQAAMRALCTMAVVPAAPAMREVLEACGGDLTKMVHHAQSVVQHHALPIGHAVRAQCTVTGLYDLRRFAMLELNTTLHRVPVEPAIEPALLAVCTSSLVFLGGGGFGGITPPRAEKSPAAPTDSPPTHTVREATLVQQAALYRLSGDDNPLHIDPEFAAKLGFDRGPILHGLASYGFAARHLEQATGMLVQQITAQFKNPVWPGETLVTSVWDMGSGVYTFQMHAAGRPDLISAGHATLI